MSRDLTKLETAKLLRRLKACPEARKWARGMTLRRAWTTCPRGDWLDWLAEALGVRMSPEAWRAYEAARAEPRRAAVPYEQIRDAARELLGGGR